jgi:pyruvate dehydrogenase (quinone)
MEVNLVGDAAETLRVLIPYLERKTDRAWRKQIEDNKDAADSYLPHKR